MLYNGKLKRDFRIEDLHLIIMLLVSFCLFGNPLCFSVSVTMLRLDTTKSQQKCDPYGAWDE